MWKVLEIGAKIIADARYTKFQITDGPRRPMAGLWRMPILARPLIIALGAVTLAAGPLPQAEPDAARLKTGEFLYSDQQNGKALGRDRIVIAELANGTYRFSDEAIGYADQKWSAVAGRSFEPISAELAFGGGAEQHQVFDIRYGGGRVSGFYLKGRGADAKRVAVDAAVARGVIDQRIDWAAVMASQLTVGQRFAFHVYDPAIATSGGVATVEAPERIRVPAGEFNVTRVVYRIEKPTGAEQYVVFINTRGPRMLIREDFPDGTSLLLAKAP